MGKVVKWSEAEDNVILSGYSEYNVDWCLDRLDRSRNGIIARAKHLGVKSKRRKLKYRKETLVPIVSTSKSLSDVLRHLGLRCAGGNYQTINKYIEEYSIDTSHFDSDGERVDKLMKWVGNNRMSMGEILVENSRYSRASLKKRLVSEEILEYKCGKCENVGKWLGEDLALQLEHKNGVHNDNRLENLEFLCPNCHSQTPTYAGKSPKCNKLREEQKINGGLSDKQLLSAKNRRVVDRPSMETLTKELEESGYSGTGRKYGVSDNAVRKWVQHYTKFAHLNL